VSGNGWKSRPDPEGVSMPLSHIRVVDLCRAREAPTCIRQRSESGPQVIKVERPEEQDDDVGGRHGFDFQNLHPNKRSLTLNLKPEAGREVLYRLGAGGGEVAARHP